MTVTYTDFIDCQYCDQRFNPSDTEALADHWRECPNHPARVEIERLQDQLHAARQVCDAARAVFESGAMYDAGDLCRECGAERWEDGNCDHLPGCALGELETQVVLWVNSLLPRK